LLDVLEGRNRKLRLPNGEVITVGQNVHFVGSGNIGASFTLEEQDAASRDRWLILDVWFMPHEVELAHCLKMYPNCPTEQLDIFLKVANAIRDEIVKGDQSKLTDVDIAPSVRRSERAAMLLSVPNEEGEEPLPLLWIMEKSICNQYKGGIKAKHTQKGLIYEFITTQLEALGALS
jgi:hypothetical protein